MIEDSNDQTPLRGIVLNIIDLVIGHCLVLGA
jgi:hypothetical protein